MYAIRSYYGTGQDHLGLILAGQILQGVAVCLIGKVGQGLILDNTSQVHCNQFMIDQDPDQYVGGQLIIFGVV